MRIISFPYCAFVCFKLVRRFSKDSLSTLLPTSASSPAPAPAPPAPAPGPPVKHPADAPPPSACSRPPTPSHDIDVTTDAPSPCCCQVHPDPPQPLGRSTDQGLAPGTAAGEPGACDAGPGATATAAAGMRAGALQAPRKLPRKQYASKLGTVVASIKVTGHDVATCELPALQQAACSALKARLGGPDGPFWGGEGGARVPCMISVLCTQGCVHFIFTVTVPADALNASSQLHSTFMDALPPSLQLANVQVDVVSGAHSSFAVYLPPAISHGASTHVELQLPEPLPPRLQGCNKLLAVQDSTYLAAHAPLDATLPTVPCTLPPLPVGAILHLHATKDGSSTLLPLAAVLVLPPAAAKELNDWVVSLTADELAGLEGVFPDMAALCGLARARRGLVPPAAVAVVNEDPAELERSLLASLAPVLAEEGLGATLSFLEALAADGPVEGLVVEEEEGGLGEREGAVGEDAGEGEAVERPEGEGQGAGAGRQLVLSEEAVKLLRVDGWNLLGFLLTQMFCLLMAVRRGFLVPWQAAIVCNVLTSSVLALRLTRPMLYYAHRFALLVVCRAACTLGALFSACGLIESMAVKLELGHFDLQPGAAGLAAMASCTIFKSTFLREHMGRSSVFFHFLEVLGIGLAGLKTFPQMYRTTPHINPYIYWGVVIAIWGILPILISTCVLSMADVRQPQQQKLRAGGGAAAPPALPAAQEEQGSGAAAPAGQCRPQQEQGGGAASTGTREISGQPAGPLPVQADPSRRAAGRPPPAT